MPGSIIQDAGVTVYFDGVAHRVDPGLSVAAALTALDRADFSTDAAGEKRGLFCGMGVCHDCLVTVDSRTSQRACMTPVRDGMRVDRQQARPDITSTDLADLRPVPTKLVELDIDLLVIGAGPGGLAAAVAAAEAGASVTVVDERHTSGGQFFKQPNTDAARRALKADRQAADGAALIERARSLGVTICSGVTVWGAAHGEDGRVVISCLGHDGLLYCRPTMLVIGTGAFERPPAIKGWTLPGVMTAGAAQTLLRSYGTLPGRRILIAGNGPLNFQVASEILKAGGDVVCLVEQAGMTRHLP